MFKLSLFFVGGLPHLSLELWSSCFGYIGYFQISTIHFLEVSVSSVSWDAFSHFSIRVWKCGNVSIFHLGFFLVIHLEPCPWCPCNGLTSLIPLAPKSNHFPSLAIELGTRLLLSTSGLHKFWVVRRFGKISVSWDHLIYIYYIYRLGNNTHII